MDTKDPDTTPLPSEPDEVILLDPIHVNEPEALSSFIGKRVSSCLERHEFPST
jgi:hypothetical protein